MVRPPFGQRPVRPPNSGLRRPIAQPWREVEEWTHDEELEELVESAAKEQIEKLGTLAKDARLSGLRQAIAQRPAHLVKPPKRPIASAPSWDDRLAEIQSTAEASSASDAVGGMQHKALRPAVVPRPNHVPRRFAPGHFQNAPAPRQPDSENVEDAPPPKRPKFDVFSQKPTPKKPRPARPLVSRLLEQFTVVEPEPTIEDDEIAEPEEEEAWPEVEQADEEVDNVADQEWPHEENEEWHEDNGDEYEMSESPIVSDTSKRHIAGHDLGWSNRGKGQLLAWAKPSLPLPRPQLAPLPRPTLLGKSSGKSKSKAEGAAMSPPKLDGKSGTQQPPVAEPKVWAGKGMKGLKFVKGKVTLDQGQEPAEISREIELPSEIVDTVISDISSTEFRVAFRVEESVYDDVPAKVIFGPGPRADVDQAIEMLSEHVADLMAEVHAAQQAQQAQLERLQAEAAEKAERERLEAAKAERQRLEAEAAEKAERERLAAVEKVERERLQAESAAERARLEAKAAEQHKKLETTSANPDAGDEIELAADGEDEEFEDVPFTEVPYTCVGPQVISSKKPAKADSAPKAESPKKPSRQPLGPPPASTSTKLESEEAVPAPITPPELKKKKSEELPEKRVSYVKQVLNDMEMREAATPVLPMRKEPLTVEDWLHCQDRFSHMPALPQDWIRIKSSSGAIYFMNYVTGEQSIRMPGTQSAAPPIAAPSASARSLPPGWEEVTSKSTGKIYYRNIDKGISTFDFPTE
mmetsp:Transcript_80618/g.125621  ORF Transcript_80618/g.125621 Transcript_80618/m.125621 type:complete len:749 (+) Transcript_80618:2-2248(+)